MMRIKLVLATVACAMVLPAVADITLLNHYNNSFDATIAKGSATGTTFGTPAPTFGTGLFSTNCFEQTAVEQGVTYDAVGNIETDGGGTGWYSGMTFGFWAKFQTPENSGVGRLLRIQSGTAANDWFEISVGGGGEGLVRATFNDSSVPWEQQLQSTAEVNETSWFYCATTVQLWFGSTTQMTLSLFDENGNSVYAGSLDISHGAWEIATAGSVITVGGQLWHYDPTNLFVEEFSIDNKVLSSTEISDRVAYMVSGHQIPEPITISLLCTGLVGMVMKSSRKVLNK